MIMPVLMLILGLKRFSIEHKNEIENEKGKKYRDFIFMQVPRLHGNEVHYCAVFVQNENEQTCFDGKKGKICDEAGARE